MARNTDKRIKNDDIQYLYTIWSRVDSQIKLPAVLTGDALISKLEGIEHPAPNVRKIRFSPHVFTWQSGVTYAAAFALIVALSLFLNRGDNQADILQGQIEMQPGAMERAETPSVFSSQEAAEADQAVEPEADADAQADAGQSAEAFAVAEDRAGDIAGWESQPEGIGGQSESILLGVDERYTYTYRLNDPTDPDKEGYPITVNIIDSQSGELACTFDISQELSLAEYYVNGDVLALVGSLSEDGAAVIVYNIANMAEPAELIRFIQEGGLADSNLYGSILRLVTLTESAEGLDCEIINLPGAITEACCVITAVDLDTMQVETKAFAGINGGEVSLYDLHAYVNYEGEQTEQDASGKRVAQIRLDGMTIELADGEVQQ